MTTDGEFIRQRKYSEDFIKKYAGSGDAKQVNERLEQIARRLDKADAERREAAEKWRGAMR